MEEVYVEDPLIRPDAPHLLLARPPVVWPGGVVAQPSDVDSSRLVWCHRSVPGHTELVRGTLAAVLGVRGSRYGLTAGYGSRAYTLEFEVLRDHFKLVPRDHPFHQMRPPDRPDRERFLREDACHLNAVAAAQSVASWAGAAEDEDSTRERDRLLDCSLTMLTSYVRAARELTAVPCPNSNTQLRDVLFAALVRGRRLLSDPAAAVAASASYALDGTEPVSAERESGGEPVLVGEGVELVTELPSPVEPGVFPQAWAHHLSSVSVRYRRTVHAGAAAAGVSGHAPGDNDLDYRVWSGNRVSGWTTRDECRDTIQQRWSRLRERRDPIARLASHEGPRLVTGAWSLYGTRAHRKCYARTLLGKTLLQDTGENDGVDYNAANSRFLPPLDNDAGAVAEGDSAWPDPPWDRWPSHLVLAQSGYLAGPEGAAWHEMNEVLRADDLVRSRGVYWRDVAPVEHFVVNLRAALRKLVAADYAAVTEVAPEFSVYWPFGLHATAPHLPGRPYETRVDLVLWGRRKDTGSPECVLVEYKTRMELSSSTGRSVFALSSADRLQLRLNAWMLYLCSGVWPGACYVVQASRRQPDDGEGVRAVATRLDLREYAAQPGMVRLVTAFALAPYGPGSLLRYVDSRVVVPDASRLASALGLSVESAYSPSDGRHELFSEVLRGCDFSRMVDAVVPGAEPETGPTTVVGLPEECLLADDSPSVFARVAPHLCVPRLGRGGLPVGDAYRNVSQRWSYVAPPERDAWQHALLVADRMSFAPLLFDRRTGEPLLYCAKHVPLRVARVVFEGRGVARANKSAVPPRAAAALFRQPDTVQFGRRLRFGNDVRHESAVIATENLRVRIRRAAESGAEALERRLSRVHSDLDDVPGAEFWRMSVEKIFRRHVMDSRDFATHFPDWCEPPRIREFARLAAEPYAAAPRELEALPGRGSGPWAPGAQGYNMRRPPAAYRRTIRRARVAVLRRCLHRLLNTRLLRGALAMAGAGDADYARVVDHGRWSRDDFARWQDLESAALLDALRAGADPGQGEGAAWWGCRDRDETGRTDDYSRAECFPHFSQRAMWSMAALRAATELVSAEDSGERHTLLDVVQEHVFEDMSDAVARYLASRP